ncbi:MAG: ankyrin repeat domain-containing protein [Bacteroidota bacterium]
MEYDPDIFDAVIFGDLASIILYWAEDTDINYQENGFTLMMLAVMFNHKDIVDYLLSKKPDLDLKNNKGETVFEIAYRLEDKIIYQKLSTKERPNH